MKGRKLLAITLIAVPLLTACNETGQTDSATPIGFSTAVDEVQTRYASNDLPVSMGVFAYFTKGGDFNASSSKPNFMYNQLITNNGGAWSYSPVKYWPKNTNDKITFFAYAPHNATGFTACANTQAGYPYATYTVAQTESAQTDLLASVPLMNKSAGEVKFPLRHALTKVTLKVKSGDKYVKEITSLSINAGTTGQLQFKDGGFEWKNVTGTYNYVPETTDLTFAETDTEREVATFLLLPTATVTATYSITYKVKTTTGTEVLTRTFTAQALPAAPLWTAGAHIAYTINLSEKTATVTAGIAAWEKDADSSLEVRMYRPDEFKVGDYFYNDGSWSDGGLRAWVVGTNERTWADPLPGPLDSNPVTGVPLFPIGAVFSTETSAKDKENGWTHGYVMAFEGYAGRGAEGAWSNKVVDTAIPNGGQGLDGYTNCAALLKSAEWTNIEATDKANYPAFYNACVEQAFFAPPAGASSWYLPSYQQLILIFENLGGGFNEKTIDKLDAQINKTDGKFFSKLLRTGIYYSSDELGSGTTMQITVFTEGQTSFCLYGDSENNNEKIPVKSRYDDYGYHFSVLAF